MKTCGLKIDERRQKILEILGRDGQVAVARLSQELGTSVVTIRNDLAALEQNGYLERTYGGAVQSANNYYCRDFRFRTQQNLPHKKDIAAGVAGLVRDGETLLINSGTTTYYIAMELKQKKNLNIVTNSLMVAVELSDVPSFRVFLLGGNINARYSFTYGMSALLELQKYKADKAILSMDGISIDHGLTTYHAEEAEIDKAMIDRARQVIIAADLSKYGHESFFRVCPLSETYTWVTNAGASESNYEKIRSAGNTVIVC